ncbi:putative calcium-transporting ATPase 13, plasma membrane-type [Argentina anserina]|uniref:putative calcium-transporting ATPase 13, plasma membrane-type n=1 Tax=Argentina anserina TaxID=57926 RepID=UPI0021762DFF|nr:putative calcium-transporting ATPase 13, plasma membrane-type [Potentilla anserina]
MVAVDEGGEEVGAIFDEGAEGKDEEGEEEEGGEVGGEGGGGLVEELRGRFQDVELTRAAHLAPASPDVSEEVSSLSVEDDSTIPSTALVPDQVNLIIKDDFTTRIANEVKIQLANIFKIVREKGFATLQKFRGIKITAEALGTNAPTPSFFKLLLQSFFSWTVFLLLVCVFLTTVFGIQQEGPSNGWFEGAVGAFAIIILVLVPTMRKYFSVPHLRNTSQMKVKVDRQGNLLLVNASDVVPGDIVCLESRSLVPADGSCISTKGSLVLKDGTEVITVDDSNPSLVYGARVVNGSGRMLVTCAGMKTALGEVMAQVRCTPNLQDQLPAQLDNLSTKLQNVGLLIMIFMTLVLIIRSRVLKDNEYPGLQADQLKGRTTASEELINVISRFFMKSSGQISVLATYLPLLIVGLAEGVPFSVALAITYWTKTTLSGKAIAQRLLACYTMGSVSTICIGGGMTLIPELEFDLMSNDGDQIIESKSVPDIQKHVREALYKGINAPLLMPSTSFSSTLHRLLLPWANSSLGLDNENLMKNCTAVSEKLSTDEEASRVLMMDSETGDICLYWSGPASTILPMCLEYYDSKGTTKLMDEEKKRDLNETAGNMQSKHLKTIAFAHKKIDGLMPEEENSLILTGLLSVKVCSETMKALQILQKSGVDVIEFPRDHESLPPEGESPVFGMGRPLDKLHTVQRLRDKGHVVAMVGDKTLETPALKEADVAITVGNCCSEMAREVSDLIIHNGSLSFVVTIIKIGRCIHCNIQKYIQVELTMNTSLLVTMLVTTIFLGDCTVGAIEVTWANLLVTFCGLALLVEPPTQEQMERTPIKQTDSLISKAMWRNILLQALYQTSVLVALQFKWKALPVPGINKKIMESMVFNSYVLCQVFNLVSSREVEKKHVFRGIRTPWLWVAMGLSVPMQEAFVEIAHEVAGHARLDWAQWGVCFLVAIGSWPIDLAGKFAWGVVRKIRIKIGSGIRSTSMRSASVSEAASSRELLATC